MTLSARSAFAPNVDQEGLDRIAEEKHLNDSVFVRYGYWARDAVTNNFGDHPADEQADPARPLARDEEHAPARDRRRADRDPHRDRHRRTLRLTPVLVLRLHGDDVQLPRPGDAVVLARADAPGARGAGPIVDGLQDLSHRQSQRRGPGQRPQLLRRPRAPPGSAGAGAHGGEHRRVLSLHARARCSRS